MPPRRTVPVRRSALLAAALVLSLGACASPATSTSTPTPTLPPAASAQTALGSSPSYLQGPTDTATVTVVEFFDFQCPPCGRLAPVLEQLADDYAGQVDFVARNYPLPMHDNAMSAAIAGEAAAQQGAFDDYFSAVFEQQAAWSELSADEAVQTFRVIAESLDLDLAAWDAAVADPATRAAVQEDLDDGVALGVRGTPSLFIDGVQTTPNSADDLRRAIDAALDAAGD